MPSRTKKARRAGSGPRRLPSLLAACVSWAACLAVPGACAAEATLTLLVVDAGTGGPTEARISVTDSAGNPLRPAPDSLCLFHEPLHGFFYADSSAVMEVPEGPIQLRAAKGPEFLRFQTSLSVLSDTTVVVSLARWIDMGSVGWVGGDAHVHLTHPPVDYFVDAAEAILVQKAEGLRIATIVDHGYLFTGGVHPLSDAEAVLFGGEEYRSPIFGHLSLLGLDTLVAPDWGHIGWPLNAEVVREVRGHAHALASYAHPETTTDFFDLAGWPGTGLAREVWVDAALGLLDALDVLSYSNLVAPGFAADSLWHHLWNCGFAVPGLAGTDAGVGDALDDPVGALRVYAHVPDPQAPPQALYDSWIESARRGRTFVSTGPLLTAFEVGGAGAGETLYIQSGMPLDVTVHARFEWSNGLRDMGVMRNGNVVETFPPPGSASYEIQTSVPIRESCWIGVYHDGYFYDDFGPTTRAYAEPTPVLVLLEGDGLTSAVSGSHALRQIDLLDSLLSLVAEYPSVEESLAVAGGIHAARTVWEARSNAAPKAFHLQAPCYGCLLPDASPLFLWTEALDPDPSGSVTYRLVLAEDAEFEHILADTSGFSAPAWTPAAPFEVGRRYWWRVSAEDGEGAVRWAEEIDWWFEPATATGAPSGGEVSPVFFAPSPNPSGPALGDAVFSWSSSRGASCTVTLFDPAGRLVRTLVLRSGTGSAVWDGRDGEGRGVPGGVYLYRMAAGGAVRTGKICVVR